MKNILIVTDYTAPYEGNFIASIKKLEREIIEKNGKFYYLFTRKAKNVGWINSLENVFYLENNIQNNIKIISNIIDDKKIDIVYSHFCLPKTQLAVKISTTLNKKVKLFQHFHNHYEAPKEFFKKYIFKWIFNGDLNIGCSEDVAKSLPFKEKKVTFVTNAIDFSRLDKYENIKLDTENKFIVLMFGYTYYRKGVDLAIKAISKLNNENIVLAISVSKNVDEFKQNIIDDFGEVPKFVKILEPRNDIATYYKASNLFLSAAREEGFCYAIVESMYCGTPCICTKLQGQPNEIPDLITVQKEDIDSLAININRVISNENRFNYENIKKYLIKNYGIDSWSNKIIEKIENE